MTGMISDTIPKEGKIKMYTSGWPKIQNKCCHSNGSAPWATLKKFDPNRRSKDSKKSATVMTGMENSSRNWVTNCIQVNTGIRNSDMPGARMFNTVTMRLTEPIKEAAPAICRPNA